MRRCKRPSRKWTRPTHESAPSLPFKLYSKLARLVGRLHSVGDIERLEQAADVYFDCLLRKTERSGNLFVRQPTRNQRQHLDLALGEQSAGSARRHGLDRRGYHMLLIEQ